MSEISKAEEIRHLNDIENEPLLNLILSGKDKIEARLDTQNIHCPLCTGDEICIVETAEGDSERVYFQMKCNSCGCEFVMLEDLADSCRRGIENAKADIEYNKNKIEYFKKTMHNV